jgi:Xaa-Pro aminopeptidase
MKTDLDSLMQSRNLDALFVIGPGRHNPPMVYLTGGANLTHATLIKKRGATPHLFHGPMERDEAAKTGLPTHSLDAYDFEALLKQAGGDRSKATVAMYQTIMKDIGLISGRVALYGYSDAGEVFALFSALQSALPGITFVGEMGDSLLFEAMSTKEDDEIKRIRRMGQVTISVVEQVADYLTSHRVKDSILVKPDGSPLTIGDVKSRINLWLAERSVENPQETIFAIGHDAGVPHSVGDPDAFLRLGQTIVFDIFPCETGGGYFYDFTRTWCLGYAPDEVLKLYDDVLAVYRQVVSELRPGALCRTYQELTCDLFKERGHLSLRDDPQIQQGYTHSLGHGVGLNLHERPAFRLSSPETEILKPGTVITVEPGLYYPEKGMGVRLEDTFCLHPDGKFEILAPYPLDLILPVK